MIEAYTAHLHRKNRAAGTIRLRLFYIEKFASWFGRDLALADDPDMRHYLAANRDWLPSTRSSATATLKAFYGWAHREGLLTQNPARDLPNVIVPRRRQPIASEEAIKEAVQCDDISDRAMVLLGAECGMRVNEIATLHRDNRDGDWLHVIGKGGVQRDLHVSPELAELLDHIETTTMRHGWYFPGRSGFRPIHVSTAWRHIRAVLASNPHSLRRRAGTVVYRRSGNDIRLAQTFLGHARSTTTEGYLEVGDDDLMHAGALARIAA
jgi:integrase